MAKQQRKAKRYLALRQVRKSLPAPVRITESKKSYKRARERKKITAEITAPA